MVIWDWVLAVYDRPGVPELTLRLQDEYGQNTSFLLWAAWARAEDRALLARAAETTRRWDAVALAPLRAVRRALKPPFAGVQDVAKDRLRQEVKAAELNAEKTLMEALETLAGRRDGVASATSALQTAAEVWGQPAPGDLLSALARALD